MEQRPDKNARAQLEIADKTIPLELVTELVLPDYKSEVSRLLRVQPTVEPPSRFVSGERADLSGCVRYEVLYAGPDGKLYSADAEDSYAFSLPIEAGEGDDLSEGVEVDAWLSPDVVLGRVTAPRKLSLRCRMHARVRACATKNLSEKQKGRAAALERLCDCAESGRIFTGGSDTVDLDDHFSPDNAEQLRVVSARGQVLFGEVTAIPDAVRCRGEAVVTLLCAYEDREEPPFTLTRRLPFEREVPLPGVGGDCHARAQGCVTEVRASVEEGSIDVSAVVVLSAFAQTNEPVLLTKDAYAPGFQVECRARAVKLWQSRACGNRHFSIAAEAVPTELGVPEGAFVIDAVADAEVGEIADGAISGNVHCHILYQKDGEYGTAELKIPFRTPIDKGAEQICAACTVPIVHVRRERDRLRADAEICLSFCGFCTAQAQALCEVAVGDATAVSRADLELYYPARGESLWSVGKRYGVAYGALATFNGIGCEQPGSTASLDEVSYLLIP